MAHLPAVSATRPPSQPTTQTDQTRRARWRSGRRDAGVTQGRRVAIREYVEQHSRANLLDQVMDEEFPRYAEALRRLGE